MDDLERHVPSLVSGYLSRHHFSDQHHHPELIVNDKFSGKKVLFTIVQELATCDEFWISAAFLTMGGLATLLQSFVDLSTRPVRGKILISDYLSFSDPRALAWLADQPNIETRLSVNSSLHAKGYFFRKANEFRVMVGSSNLTAQALCTNGEWNLKVSALEESQLVRDALEVFHQSFDRAYPVSRELLDWYRPYHLQQRHEAARQAGRKLPPTLPLLTPPRVTDSPSPPKELESLYVAGPSTVTPPELVGSVDTPLQVTPNKMQVEALERLRQLRGEGKTRALLISATGTGKTFLSAFDSHAAGARTVLFVVHRANIALAAMRTFQAVFGGARTMGFFTGDSGDAQFQFLFATIQNLTRGKKFERFVPSYFDYIVVDETHRAGAESYTQLIEYFQPKFLLGMTATPERTDGYDVFQLFQHVIAYEIRLHRALDEGMLAPFHYHGITDLTVEGQTVDDHAAFHLLASPERVKHILEKVAIYSTDDEVVRGLVFCSTVEESKALAKAFVDMGRRAIALSGESSETERAQAIERLESNDPQSRLEFIFTRDIFNEGVDIPRVNLVVLLRPTQSTIVFVQQLGRGLRKADGKEFLTVLDFIGNYASNFMVPIALYGETSFNKDDLRRHIASGSLTLPGTSTVTFDQISRERIFQSINRASLNKKADLTAEFKILKFQLGRRPWMVDFLELGRRDPRQYAVYSGSYFEFCGTLEEVDLGALTPGERAILKLVADEIADGIRPHESVLLLALINNGHVDFSLLEDDLRSRFSIELTQEEWRSSLNNLRFQFVRENYQGKLVPTGSSLGFSILDATERRAQASTELLEALQKPLFRDFLVDQLEASLRIFGRDWQPQLYSRGFVRHRKYSRRDVFRVLNWEQNPVAQNVGGYIVSPDGNNCPIFVTYHKDESISEGTKYDDGFLSPSSFKWMSKNRRTLTSPDVVAIRNATSTNMRIPLFVKKSDDEGLSFYYIGELTPIQDSFRVDQVGDSTNGVNQAVRVEFHIDRPVEPVIYSHLTNAPSLA